jgi:hypothetical protein
MGACDRLDLGVAVFWALVVSSQSAMNIPGNAKLLIGVAVLGAAAPALRAGVPDRHTSPTEAPILTVTTYSPR